MSSAQVKQLNWSGDEGAPGADCTAIPDPFHTYVVRHLSEDTFDVILNTDTGSLWFLTRGEIHATYAAAKAAAQGDYDKRRGSHISALEPGEPAQPVGLSPEHENDLQEIADGAWGDGPRTRGLARDRLASLATPVSPTPATVEALQDELDTLQDDNSALKNEIDRLEKALSAALSGAPAGWQGVPKGWRLVPEKPTDEMMYRAACAHYGKRRAINIDGLAMTVDGIDHSFRTAFKRFWKGALAALPASPADEGETR